MKIKKLSYFINKSIQNEGYQTVVHTFRRVEDQLRRTGSLTRQRRTIRTDEEKETSVLLNFIENKRTSIRIVACNLEVSRSYILY